MTEQESDPVMERIGEAIGLSHRGEREQARELFAAIWADIGPDGDPFHRCTLAHYAADVQPDPQDELMWDLRALAAADGLTDERAQAYQASLSVAWTRWPMTGTAATSGAASSEWNGNSTVRDSRARGG